MASVRNFDGIISQNDFRTTSTWYKIGREDGLAGREWKCSAAGQNAHALIDYDAGFNAGRGDAENRLTTKRRGEFYMADFTVADVLAWARTKPADEVYSYSSNENCAVCQFLRETGRADHPSVGATTWTAWAAYPYSGRVIGGGEFAWELNAELVMADTFDTLVKSLEKLCPETPVTRSDWLSIDAYLSDIEQVVSA